MRGRACRVVVLTALLVGCPPAPTGEPTTPAPQPNFRPWAALSDVGELPRLGGRSPRAFSSYDRAGGNDDGLSGAWSALRVEDGDSVIAELEGPGVINRLWTTHSRVDLDGLLVTREEHVRIHLDGSPCQGGHGRLHGPWRLSGLLQPLTSELSPAVSGQDPGGYCELGGTGVSCPVSPLVDD